VLKLVVPDIAPKGFTTVLLSIGFFGSVDLFALAMIGEYVTKIFEEVKQRPLFIRPSVIKDGEIRPAADVAPAIENRPLDNAKMANYALFAIWNGYMSVTFSFLISLLHDNRSGLKSGLKS
jgi:hypothetical protein